MRRAWFLGIGFGLLVAGLSAPVHAQSWGDAYAKGDWLGRERSCTQGETPDPAQCTPATMGQVAVCWSNNPGCGGSDAWCTYKTVQLSTPQDGKTPGEIYQCQKD
jgi:hypothetical protein